MAKKKSHEQFVSEIDALGIDITILGTYEGSAKPITVVCNKCDTSWAPTAGRLLRGAGCPTCGRVRATLKNRKSHDQFVTELLNVNPNIVVLENYVNAKTKILCHCEICKNEWKAEPSGLLKGVGCPACVHTGTSFVEQFLFRAFEIALGEGNVLSRDRKTIGKELDIVIPSIGIAVEPGSWFWHKDKIKKDFEKIYLCKENGIELIVLYDTCKGACNINDANVYWFDENLGDEANRSTLVDFIHGMFAKYGIEYSFSDEEMREISRYAYWNSRKKTTEEFVNEIYKINSSIEVLSDYKNSKTNVKCRCRECGYEWKATPNALLRGTGCKKCAYVENAAKRTWSQEEFLEKLEKVNSHVEILGEYRGANTRIECRCKNCGYEWRVKPADLLTGRGCYKCSIKKRAQKHTKTHESFVAAFEAKNPSITVLGVYKKRKEPIKCECKECGLIWEPLPYNLLNGAGCQRCSGKERYTTESFTNKVAKINPNVTILGDYVNKKTPVLCKCNICDFQWESFPDVLFNGGGCPLCAGKVKYDNVTFRKKMNIVNPNIEILDDYTDRDCRLRVKCKICGHEWSAIAKLLLRGRDCPKRKYKHR